MSDRRRKLRLDIGLTVTRLIAVRDGNDAIFHQSMFVVALGFHMYTRLITHLLFPGGENARVGIGPMSIRRCKRRMDAGPMARRPVLLLSGTIVEISFLTESLDTASGSEFSVLKLIEPHE